MPTKKQLITNKINNFLLFAEEHNLPFQERLRKSVKKYDIKHIVGLVERFLVPAEDCLEEYLAQELNTMKLIHPQLQELQDFQLTEAILERVVGDIQYVIKVIKL